MRNLEYWISRAEIEYKSGQAMAAIRSAKRAIKYCDSCDKRTALNIFIARAYSKLRLFSESNAVYRNLINDKIYLAPVIIGLFYNHLHNATPEKQKLNLSLVKTLLLNQG